MRCAFVTSVRFVDSLDVALVRYLSYQRETGEVTLVPRVTGENETWKISNSFLPNASATIESGGLVSSFRLPGFP